MEEENRVDARRGAIAAVLVSLFLSGIAGLVNQVVWQRALKIHLGGSETISAMVVVLVFLFGLGVGAGLAGALAHRARRPLRVFGLIEATLFCVNVAIALLLSLDLDASISEAQRIAVAAGVPLRAVYALGALAVLSIPTVLMGATLPIASEACQRQLGAERASLITVLFLLNTVGAAVGALSSSFWMLPIFGQRTTLLTAAGFNLGAALCALALSVFVAPAAPAEAKSPRREARLSWARPRPEEWLGLGLGLLSLGYEMVLFRLIALVYEPLPYTFALTLCLFLLFWSLGLYASARYAPRIPLLLVATAALVAVTPPLYVVGRTSSRLSLLGGGLLFFFPCVGFGLLYGALLTRLAREWGQDVGRFYAFNTAGSCAGIAAFTLVGYEMPLGLEIGLIAAGLMWLLGAWLPSREGAKAGRPALALRVASSVAMAALLVVGLTTPYTRSALAGARAYWGRDGVVEILANGDIYLDGLWHTRLYEAGDSTYLGDSYTWMMAVAAVLAHDETPIRDALVIGNGVGVTSTTLAKLAQAHVDAYEIDHTLQDVLKDFERETFAVAHNPKVAIEWTDGRSGMALNPKRYDLIVSAPLHLRQAGSSLLLSREYFELLRRRLEPGGVIAVYAHEGQLAQSMLVRRTVQAVFAHQQTFDDGVILVASDAPIEITPEKVAALLRRPDPVFREMLAVDRMLRRNGEHGLLGRVDHPSAPILPGPEIIRDDRPLVEYPEIAAWLLGIPSPD